MSIIKAINDAIITRIDIISIGYIFQKLPMAILNIMTDTDYQSDYQCITKYN